MTEEEQKEKFINALNALCDLNDLGQTVCDNGVPTMTPTVLCSMVILDLFARSLNEGHPLVTMSLTGILARMDVSLFSRIQEVYNRHNKLVQDSRFNSEHNVPGTDFSDTMGLKFDIFRDDTTKEND